MTRRTLAMVLCLALLCTLPSLGATPAPKPSGSQYSLQQAMSDNAQLTTIAFSGLAFITGSAGADTFMPPGKVADFFGFQYMRDVDVAGYGHNTTFLSRVANNVLFILNDSQKQKLISLAKEQAPLYVAFAYNRFPLMTAFRRSLTGQGPTASALVDQAAVAKYTGQLYRYDAQISYQRAVVVGEILNSLTETQKSYLVKMAFDNYATWPDVQEDEALKRSMTNDEFVAVMTYASELFSWYKGSLDADVYFCPERHGTYFGGFYMKDYPAMNNPQYFISTSITGDSGKAFLEVLDSQQRGLITGILAEQKVYMTEIATVRTAVATELRKAMTGAVIDKAKLYSWIERYGQLDGMLSALYAQRFSQVNRTLTDAQRTALVKLRNLSVVPQGAYKFSTPVPMPEVPNTDFLFGKGEFPSLAAQYPVPSTFTTVSKQPQPQQPQTQQPQTQQPQTQQSVPSAAKPMQNSTIRVVLNGQPIGLDTEPIIQNGRVLVGISGIAKALKATTGWNAKTQSVQITLNNSVVQMKIGQPLATVSGRSIALDQPAQLVNNRTMLPLSFVATAFNIRVRWDATSKTVWLED